jgi:hypothetical protein
MKKMTWGIDQDRQRSMRDWKEISDVCKLRVTADECHHYYTENKRSRQTDKEGIEKQKKNK